MTHRTIEAMARAICVESGGNYDAMPRDQKHYLDMALAALRALAACEPSGGMVLAADEVHYVPQPAPDPSRLPRMKKAIWVSLAELVKECERDA